MILLRYGIRCSLHYSVPLTLGLIAYTGSWQGVARNLMSETKVGGKPNPADAKATEVAAGKDGTGNSTTGSGLHDRPEGESLAMNPESGDAPRSLTIPRADSRRSHDPVADSASNGSSRSRSEPDRPPRDRDIDATGHQATIAQSDPNRSGPSLSAGMAAGAAGLAYVAVNPLNIGSQQVTAPMAKPEKAIEKSPEPAASPTELASEATGSGSDPGTKTDGSNPPQTADAANRKLPAATQPDAAIAVASSGEPAHLNPQIRAIAAEVPIAASIAESVHPESSKPSDRPEDIQTASRANESAKPSQEVRQDPPAPVASAAPPAEVAALKAGPKENVPVDSPKVVAKADSKTESTQPSTVDRKNLEIPDVVIAQEGESWNRIAARIYGDEKMAETIWRENRDAHGGSSDAMPIAGRMVRLPEAGKRYAIPNPGQTQLARTVR